MYIKKMYKSLLIQRVFTKKISNFFFVLKRTVRQLWPGFRNWLTAFDWINIGSFFFCICGHNRLHASKTTSAHYACMHWRRLCMHVTGSDGCACLPAGALKHHSTNLAPFSRDLLLDARGRRCSWSRVWQPATGCLHSARVTSRGVRRVTEGATIACGGRD
jgi:hypothetical protein